MYYSSEGGGCTIPLRRDGCIIPLRGDGCAGVQSNFAQFSVTRYNFSSFLIFFNILSDAYGKIKLCRQRKIKKNNFIFI